MANIDDVLGKQVRKALGNDDILNNLDVSDELKLALIASERLQRIAELERQLAEVQQQLEDENSAHAAAMKYFQEVSDKAEELRRHRRLLRAVAVAWVWSDLGQYCYHCGKDRLDSEPDAHFDNCPYRAAVDAGALGDE